MILKQLRLLNIGRYQNENIDFTSVDNLSLIVGKNGAGKSTIFDAILWAIFGKTSKDTAIDEIVKLGSEYGSAELTLEDSKHQYIIQRVRNVKKQITNLTFTVDDKNISGAILSETENTIQQFLKTDFVTFRNSIFFGQDEVNQFVKGTDKERKDVLTRFLNLEIYDRALLKVKEYKTKAASEITLWKQNKTDLETQHTNLTTIQKSIDEAQTRYDDLKQQKDKAVADGTAYVAHSNKRFDEVKIKIEALKALRTHKDKIQRFYDSIRQKQSVTATYKVQLEQIDQSSLCPTCKQEMDKDTRQQTRKQIIKEGNAIVLEIQEIFKQIAIPTISKLEDLAHTLRELNIKLEGEQTLQDESLQIQLEINKYDPKTLAEQYDYRIQSEEQFINTQTQTIQGFNNFLAHIEELDKKIQQNEKQVEILLKLEDVFGTNGIKTAIIENVVSSLEEKINNIINQLTSGITVSLETQVQGKTGKLKEKFSIYVYDTNGKREFRTYSGGEKRIISVAIRFAFAELALERSNSLLEFLLLDEVTDAFDDTRKETFYTLLEELKSRYNQIFIISHDNVFKDMFGSIIEIEKDSSGTSHIRRDNERLGD